MNENFEMDTSEGAEAQGKPLISVKRVSFLRAEGLIWDDGRLARWWRRMGKTRCSCGAATPHCCPFTVIIGEADFGLHPWVQWAAFEEHGLLPQTVQEYCCSRHARVAHGPPGHCKYCHAEVQDVRVAHGPPCHCKVRDVKVHHPQADHCKVGHDTGALVQAAAGPDQSVDSSNGMLMCLEARSRSRKRRERRRRLAAATGVELC